MAGKHCGQVLAAASTQGRTAVEGERNVTAELSPKRVQVPSRHAKLPQRVHRHQHRRRVGTPPSHATGHRDRLIDRDRDIGGTADVLGQQLGRPPREVAIVDRQRGRALTRNFQRQHIRSADGHLVE